jgi:hypothetical protein
VKGSKDVEILVLRLKGTQTSDRGLRPGLSSRSLDLHRVAATMGRSRPSAEGNTCFVNIVRSQRPKKARNPAAPSHSLYVYERPQVRVGWAR